MANDIGPIPIISTDLGPFDNQASVAYSPDLGTDGWTTIPEPVTGRKVYVSSSSGSDSNDGLSEGAPKASAAAGYALIRDGYDDHLLFKRGDEWSGPPAADGLEYNSWNKSGVDADHPIVVGAYGSGNRPKFNLTTGHQYGIHHFYGFSLHDIWFVDLDLEHDDLTEGGYGVRWLGPVSRLLIEGCRFAFFGQGMTLQGASAASPMTDVVIRRNVIVDSSRAPAQGHSQAIFAGDLAGMTVEENFFDHNGWSETEAANPATIYNHNVYFQSADAIGVVFRRNWSSRGSSHGVAGNCGYACIDNTFYENSIHAYVGDAESQDPRVLRNVCIKGKDITASDPGGWGIAISDVISRLDMNYNLAAHQDGGSTSRPSFDLAGCANVSMQGNIAYNWLAEAAVGYSGTSSVLCQGNDFQSFGSAPALNIRLEADISELTLGNNRMYSASGDLVSIEGAGKTLAQYATDTGDTTSTEINLSSVYPDPDKKMDDYAVSIGLANTAEFLTQIRTQCKGNWDLNLVPDRINAYFRSNFDMLPAPQDLTGSVSQETVSLSWNGAPEDDSYVVERSADTSSWSVATSVSSTSATDIPGTGNWYYRVTPVVNSTSGDVSDNFLAESVTGGTTNTATADITLPSLGITASAEVSASPGQTERTATATITLPSLGIVASGINVKLPGIPSSINVYLDFPNINIDWGAATSAVSYTVEMDLASSGYSELSSGITSPLSATVAYPGVGTQRFRVYATNPNGDGGTIEGFLYTAPVTPSFMGTGRGFLGKSLLELKLSF